MTPRRKQNNLSQNQPVKFYKIVAVSFLFLTLILFGMIIFMSSKRATIVITTKPEEIDVSDTITFDLEDDNVFATSTVVEISKNFEPRSTREEMSIATGVVTLYNELDYDQPLVATTRLLSTEGVLFRLKNRVTVPAEGSIEVEVYADTEGKENEIGPSKFIIPGLREDTQEFIYAKSDGFMKGGVRSFGVVTSEDLDTASEQLKAELLNLGKEKLAINKTEDYDMVVQVVDFSADSAVEFGTEVDQYSLKAIATVTGIFYNKNYIMNKAEQSLQKRIVSDVEKIKECQDEPVVTLAEYNVDDNQVVLNVFYKGLSELDPESRQIDKIMFFGKTKDEVRRYLLSLDRVNGVDIKFSPAWMHTVPHVSEHVNLIVKTVE